MARPKSYEARRVPESGGFAAQAVLRRKSSGTRILRMTSGFATAAEAREWPSSQLGQFRARQAEAQAKQIERRRRQREQQQAGVTLSLREPAEAYPHSSALKDRVELLWQEVAFRAWKLEDGESSALAIANQSVGGRWSERLSNALSGKLGEISDRTTAQALANARRLASAAADRT